MLRLYVWSGVLSDWSDGVIYALARDAVHAREIVTAKAQTAGYRNGVDTQVLDAIVGVEPVEHVEPYADWLYGGG